MHVERSDDPCELHWVCDVLALADLHGECMPPADSPLGALLASGVICGLRVDHRVVVVRVADGRCWDDVAPRVHDAVVAELRDGAQVLAAHVDETAPSLPSRRAVQEAVDRAIGGIVGEHGGGVEVVEVGPGVVLRLTGACHGCGFDDATVERASAAVHREFPRLGAVVVDRPDPESAISAPLRWSRTRRARRDRGGEVCH